MKILIISTYFPPFNAIGSRRAHSWAETWSEDGHDVTVLTQPPPPHVVTSDSFSPATFNVLRVPLPKWIQHLQARFHRTSTSNPASQPAKSSVIRGAIQSLRKHTGIFSSCRMPCFHAWWVKEAYKAVSDQQWDLVVSTFAPYACHLVGRKLKQKGKTNKWVADFRDLWTDHQAYKGILPFSWRERYLERAILCEADCISTVSEPLANRLRKKCATSFVVVSPNGFDSKLLQTLDPKPYWNDSRTHIVYTGTIYEGFQNIDPLLDALPTQPDTELVVVGRVSEGLRQAIQQRNLNAQVTVLPPVDHPTALRMQRDADLLLFLPWSKPYPGVLTGKLFEYAFSGTPVLSVGGAEADHADEFIRSHHLGTVCGSDTSSVATAISSPISSRPLVDPQAYERSQLSLSLLRTVSTGRPEAQSS